MVVKLNWLIILKSVVIYPIPVQSKKGMLLGAGNASDAGNASSMVNTLWMARNWDTSLPYENPQGGSVFFKNVDNPLWSWKHNGFTSNVDRVVATVNASYDITDWMTASFVYGVKHL